VIAHGNPTTDGLLAALRCYTNAPTPLRRLPDLLPEAATTGLTWGRRAHALRAIVEIATWEVNGELDAHRGHPWLRLRPVLEAHLTCATIPPISQRAGKGGST
jgi:hypothetical protein